MRFDWGNAEYEWSCATATEPGLDDRGGRIWRII
jgi:hypothetical protein